LIPDTGWLLVAQEQCGTCEEELRYLVEVAQQLMLGLKYKENKRNTLMHQGMKLKAGFA
jgi:hypothetical protein